VADNSKKGMNPNKLEALKEKYPDLLKEIYDIECEDGWLCLIEGYLRLASAYSSRTKRGVKIKQIKEKFGRLRVYTNHNDDYIFGIGDIVELLSEFVCESCGEKGALRTSRRRVKTLCDSHYILEE
jgi:hypothetical protein